MEAEREREREREKKEPRACPQWPNFLLLGPASQKLHHLSVAPKAGGQAFSIWPLEDTETQPWLCENAPASSLFVSWLPPFLPCRVTTSRLDPLGQWANSRSQTVSRVRTPSAHPKVFGCRQQKMAKASNGSMRRHRATPRRK
jgi:hypothetical protein